MPPKMSFWLLLRLAIPLAAFLVQSGEGASYRDFANKHIHFPKTAAPNPDGYCNLMMRRRGLTRHACKPKNTFINSSPSSIQHICRGGGTRLNHRQNLYNSWTRFRVITCRSRGRHPSCRYVGRQENRRIRVACNHHLPVHFAKLI